VRRGAEPPGEGRRA